MVWNEASSTLQYDLLYLLSQVICAIHTRMVIRIIGAGDSVEFDAIGSAASNKDLNEPNRCNESVHLNGSLHNITEE